MNRILRVLCFFGLVSTSAYGASWLECDGDSGKKQKWSGSSVSARINTGSFSTAALVDQAEQAFGFVNRNPSPFTISDSTEGGGVGDSNGQNEVYGSDISAPGVARMWMDCYWWWFFGTHWEWGLNEVDVILDSGRSWRIPTSKNQITQYGGTGRNMEAVLTHEFGHFLGLMHVDWEYNVMGDSWDYMHTNGSSVTSYFGEDASHGSRSLYGTQSSDFEDLSVSHFRYTGSDGEYSTHGRVRIFNSSGGVLSTTSVTYSGTTESAYRVNPGQTVKAEFTVENNGKNTHYDITYGIYLSTNDYIAKCCADVRLRGGTLGSMHPADPWTGQFTVTLPDDVVSGQTYWLGLVIDEDNSISEKSGVNNATYIPIRVN